MRPPVTVSIFHFEVAGNPTEILIDLLALTVIFKIDHAIGEFYAEQIIRDNDIGSELYNEEDFFLYRFLRFAV